MCGLEAGLCCKQNMLRREPGRLRPEERQRCCGAWQVSVVIRSVRSTLSQTASGSGTSRYWAPAAPTSRKNKWSTAPRRCSRSGKRAASDLARKKELDCAKPPSLYRNSPKLRPGAGAAIGRMIRDVSESTTIVCVTQKTSSGSAAASVASAWRSSLCGIQEIIGVEEGDEAAARRRDPRVACGRFPAVSRMTQEFDSRVGSHQRHECARQIVGGPVIDDQQFPVPQRLPLNRPDRLFDDCARL